MHVWDYANIFRIPRADSILKPSGHAMRRELSANNEISASRFALDSLCLPLVGCCSLRRLDWPPGPCPALSGLSLRDRSIHFHVLPRLFCMCIRPRNSNPCGRPRGWFSSIHGSNPWCMDLLRRSWRAAPCRSVSARTSLNDANSPRKISVRCRCHVRPLVPLHSIPPVFCLMERHPRGRHVGRQRLRPA